MGSDRIWRALAFLVRAAAITMIAASSLFAAGCTHSAKSVMPVRISLCGGGLQARPAVVNVICTNNSISARNLHWSGWGGPVATATGSAVVDLCAYEDCAAGDYVTVPIVLITSKIMQCASSAHAYTRLQYVFVGRSPYAGLPSKIAVADGSASPSGGPGDQTVSLTC
jgi:hypothetical protein